MKFSAKVENIALGVEAEKPVSLPLPNADTFDCLLRPLNGTQETAVLSRARASAQSEGVKEPKEGDSLYDLALMVETIAIACVDSESDPKSRQPAFDGGAAQIRDKLGREDIAYLYEAQQLWQDECSPNKASMTADELLAAILKMTEAEEGDGDPFARTRPVLRMNCIRIFGRLLLNSPEARSRFGALAV